MKSPHRGDVKSGCAASYTSFMPSLKSTVSCLLTSCRSERSERKDLFFSDNNNLIGGRNLHQLGRELRYNVEAEGR